jgi:hypothetical protein
MYLEEFAVRKTHILVLAVVTVAIVSAIGAVGAYGNLASDSTAPTTTTDAVASYWDNASIVITAADDEGIRYIYHELDEGVVRLATIDSAPLSAQVAIPIETEDELAVGTHKLKYWAQDINGNVEAQHTLTFEIVADTVKPVTSATSVSVRRGRTATLKYKVTDAVPTKGTAKATIKIKNSRGKVVKTINAGVKNVNVNQTAKFRCMLAKGTYKYYVYATDASGNAQSKIGSARLTVR